MPVPDFLVIGAPKAGTTALHAALARHEIAQHHFAVPRKHDALGAHDAADGAGSARLA